jgi:hypothetical protein
MDQLSLQILFCSPFLAVEVDPHTFLPIGFMQIEHVEQTQSSTCSLQRKNGLCDHQNGLPVHCVFVDQNVMLCLSTTSF